MMMKSARRSTLLIMALAFGAATASAQDKWPDRQFTLIVPFSAGGSTDIAARVIAKHLQERLGQTAVVENKSGAAGSIGSVAVARSPKNGYTLLVATGGSFVTAPITMKSKVFNPEQDFEPVSLLTTSPVLMVAHSSIPANSIQDLIAYLKAHPHKISYGSSGSGTTSHLGVELFKKVSGTQITHVPFRSTGDVAANMMGGHVQLAMDVASVLLPQARQSKGAIRPIAVSSIKRLPAAPDIQTLSETIPNFEILTWIGLFAPAGTPQAVLDRLNGEMKAILAMPEVVQSFEKIGAQPAYTTRAEFKTFLKKEDALWRNLIVSLGMQDAN